MVLPRAQRTLEEDMITLRHVSSMDSTEVDTKNKDIIEDMMFRIEQMNKKINSLKRIE